MWLEVNVEAFIINNAVNCVFLAFVAGIIVGMAFKIIQEEFKNRK